MYDLPDARGHFGPYGGVFVAETLVHALDELRAAYERYRKDPEFVAEAKKGNFELTPVAGEELERIVNGFFKADPLVVNKLRELLK